jgi:hypothetical protein
MPWWLLAYVQAKASVPATVAFVLGPFETRAQALAEQATWLAINTQHKATDPWYSTQPGRADG